MFNIPIGVKNMSKRNVIVLVALVFGVAFCANIFSANAITTSEGSRFDYNNSNTCGQWTGLFRKPTLDGNPMMDLVLWKESNGAHTYSEISFYIDSISLHPEGANLLFNISVCPTAATSTYSGGSWSTCSGASTLLWDGNISDLYGTTTGIKRIALQNFFTSIDATKYLFKFTNTSSLESTDASQFYKVCADAAGIGNAVNMGYGTGVTD